MKEILRYLDIWIFGYLLTSFEDELEFKFIIRTYIPRKESVLLNTSRCGIALHKYNIQ